MNINMQKTLIIPILTLCAACLAGAAEHEDEDKEKFVRVDQKITLEASEFQFEPNKLEIPVDTEIEITLKNVGVVSHNLEIHKDGEEKEIPSIQKDEKGKMTVKFSETGTYTFYCDVPGHRQAGMTGEIRVVSESGE